MHAMGYENSLYKGKIQMRDLYTGFEEEGMMYANGLNSTFEKFPFDPRCGTGLYRIDGRCRYWFEETKKAESIAIYKPILLPTDKGNASLGTAVCQKLQRFNEFSNTDEVYKVSCINISL